ncbi:hypothetical protein CN311_22055 [Mesorhizobium sanjuanii]|uniref:Uncharacterized protein n=1 Tax=Mesorhizobium sanjuanii TaxID=2037900 RepID=A0A2A6FAG8_9HYPH|nr:hypothetical protein [Mesorhizobium sanjuanii]PDQ18929.1 hypothetical protein CN311_22055 [Mesorhizobium sanjuanii]
MKDEIRLARFPARDLSLSTGAAPNLRRLLDGQSFFLLSGFSFYNFTTHTLIIAPQFHRILREEAAPCDDA